MKSGSRLERILTEGQFAVCGELGPPASADGGVVLRKAEYFRGFVDAVNVTDNQSAIARMSSMASSILLMKAGLEPVLQMTCRDRNRIAIQSDILGAAALGIKNILCLTGDYQTAGNYPTAKGVFDLDSIQLIQMLKRMRDEGRMLNGDEIKVRPAVFIGAAANFTGPLEFRVMHLAKKVEAGADFIQTQAVFDIERFSHWMKLVREAGLCERVHIMAGVVLVRSARAARYMRDSVPGIDVPEDLISRLDGAKDPKEEGLKICLETIDALRRIEGVRGVHIMPVMAESTIPTIVEQGGLLPRPI
ncbi:MAG: methylenetetrahydrofolate reductase [bacterium]